MYLTKSQVKSIVEKAIYNKTILEITYDHTTDDIRRFSRNIAPFDLGTSNPKYFERNKDNLYVFCYDHIDEKTNTKKPHVHAISSLHIINLKETDDHFDPVELTDINKKNSKYNYDYRTCKWAIAIDRKWY